jgi:hypothetical protein
MSTAVGRSFMFGLRQAESRALRRCSCRSSQIRRLPLDLVATRSSRRYGRSGKQYWKRSAQGSRHRQNCYLNTSAGVICKPVLTSYLYVVLGSIPLDATLGSVRYCKEKFSTFCVVPTGSPSRTSVPGSSTQPTPHPHLARPYGFRGYNGPTPLPFPVLPAHINL